jgi:hypothetical protein
MNHKHINQKSFNKAVINNKTDSVSFFLKDPDVNPADKNNIAIWIAAKNGYLDIVKLLLNDPRVNPVDENSYTEKYFNCYSSYNSIITFFKNKNKIIETHDMLSNIDKLKNMDLTSWYTTNVTSMQGMFHNNSSINFPIFEAAKNEHFEVVEFLIKDSRVQKSLKNQDNEMFEKLMNIILKNKISDF